MARHQLVQGQFGLWTSPPKKNVSRPLVAFEKYFLLQLMHTNKGIFRGHCSCIKTCFCFKTCLWSIIMWVVFIIQSSIFPKQKSIIGLPFLYNLCTRKYTTIYATCLQKGSNSWRRAWLIVKSPCSSGLIMGKQLKWPETFFRI